MGGGGWRWLSALRGAVHLCITHLDIHHCAAVLVSSLCPAVLLCAVGQTIRAKAWSAARHAAARSFNPSPRRNDSSSGANGAFLTTSGAHSRAAPLSGCVAPRVPGARAMGAAAAGQHHASSAGSSHAPSAVQHGQRSALHAAQPPRLGVLLFALLAWGSACGLGGAVIMDGSAESIHRLLAQFEHDVAALPPREHASQTLSLPGADGRTATGAEGQGATRSKRPNIVLVLSDDQVRLRLLPACARDGRAPG